jgi:beta-xylosidase
MRITNQKFPHNNLTGDNMAFKRLGITLGIIMMIVLIMVAALPASAQDPDGLTLTYNPDEASIWHGEDGEWDGQYTDPGAVIFHDGQFHMFRNGFVGWPAWAGIAYHTSTDGSVWNEYSDEPVLTTDEVPFAEVGALATSALVLDDGTWVLYLYTVGSSFADGPATYSIARATASDPAGPWEVYPEPVLLPGSDGEWDDAQVSAASVVHTADGYVMYYDGNDGRNNHMIGMATSMDGLVWTKYDDPATTDAPYAESDPVLMPSDNPDAWDAVRVMQPNVVQTPQGWVMSFRSSGRSPQRDQGYGFALSQDGITWNLYEDNPVFWDQEVQRRHLWYHELVYHDGMYYLIFEMARGFRNETDIYFATVNGTPFE